MFKFVGRGGILPLTAIELIFFTLFFCTVFLPASWISCLLLGQYEFFLLGLFVVLCTRFDRRSSKGGADRTYLRNSRFWSFFRTYFSGDLVIENPEAFREAAPEDKPVVFCIHPHGIVSFGVWANLLFASSDKSLSSQIPQLQSSRIVTLSLNFFYPIWSQFLTALGFIGSSAESIQEALNKGNSVGIVIGGAAESLHSIPSSKEILLHIQTRRGFIREALLQGVPLVPIFTFGEVDLFNVYVPKEGSMLYRWQRWFKQNVGFTTPFVKSFHPKPIPLITVIGPPLVVPRIENPSPSDLDYYHNEYLSHLTSFYDRNKFRDPVNTDRTLIFN